MTEEQVSPEFPEARYTPAEREANPLLAWEDDSPLFHYFLAMQERRNGRPRDKRRLFKGVRSLLEGVISAVLFLGLLLYFSLANPNSAPAILQPFFAYSPWLSLAAFIGLSWLYSYFRDKGREGDNRPKVVEGEFPATLYQVLSKGSEGGEKNEHLYLDLYLSGSTGSDLLRTVYLEGAYEPRTFMSRFGGSLFLILAIPVGVATIGGVNSFLGPAEALILAASTLPVSALWIGVLSLMPRATRVLSPFTTQVQPLWTMWHNVGSWVPSAPLRAQSRLGDASFAFSQLCILFLPIGLAMLPEGSWGALAPSFLFWIAATNGVLLLWTLNFLAGRKKRLRRAVERVGRSFEYADDLFAIFMEQRILSDDTDWSDFVKSVKSIFGQEQDRVPGKEPSGGDGARAADGMAAEEFTARRHSG